VSEYCMEFFYCNIITMAIFIALCAPYYFVIISFLGFMADKLYIFYCRKYHLICFLPKINCLQTILVTIMCPLNHMNDFGFKISNAILQLSHYMTYAKIVCRKFNIAQHHMAIFTIIAWPSYCNNCK